MFSFSYLMSAFLVGAFASYVVMRLRADDADAARHKPSCPFCRHAQDAPP